MSVEEEEEVPTIDRDDYFERYDELDESMNHSRIESNLLQRKLAVFFRRRKMEHVLKESEQQPYDTVQRYNKFLDKFKQVTIDAANMKKRVTEELSNLKNKRDFKFTELEKLFSQMQQREKEIG